MSQAPEAEYNEIIANSGSSYVTGWSWLTEAHPLSLDGTPSGSPARGHVSLTGLFTRALKEPL